MLVDLSDYENWGLVHKLIHGDDTLKKEKAILKRIDLHTTTDIDFPLNQVLNHLFTLPLPEIATEI
jgi:hypothetical protein